MAKVLARMGTVPLVADEEPMCDAVPLHVEEAPTARVTPLPDRAVAGRLLGQALIPYARSGAVVLGVANGGLAVAHGVAAELALPLDVWIVRALRLARDPALTLGVLSEGPTLRLERKGIARAGLTRDELRAEVRAAADQLAHDARRLRCGRLPTSVAGRTAILVDDGIPSAALLSAAIDGVRRRGATFVVVASPVGAHASLHRLGDEADDVVCLMTPDHLARVGAWYQDFASVGDLAVTNILTSIPAA